MTTGWNATDLDFPMVGPRQVLADCDGGDISSDGGAPLLREAEPLTAIIRQFAARCTDHRNPDLTEHTVEGLIARRVYARAPGSEDLNDHDDLRRDPSLATVVGQGDPTAKTRRRERDRGKPLAGKGTLNRLELTPVAADKDSRSKEIACRTRDVEHLFVSPSLQAHSRPPERIVLDRDATDDPIHGHRLGRSFPGDSKDFCHLPSSISCGDPIPCARLRPADIDAAAGAVEHLERIVAQVREAWPGVKVVIRGDSGSCRGGLMNGWEADGVGDVLGLAQDTRLKAMIAAERERARQEFERTKQAARVFTDLQYRTLDSWGRERRAVAQAEPLAKGATPRFVVTSLTPEDRAAERPYEEDSCGRGEIEDRIKGQQRHSFADRTGAATMRGNQVRLFRSSIAHVSLSASRRPGLAGTELAPAQCRTIRLELLKIGASVRVPVRKVWVKMSSRCPDATVFREEHANRSRLRPVMLRC